MHDRLQVSAWNGTDLSVGGVPAGTAVSELVARVAGDSSFQAQAAATGNARSPRVERRVGATCNVSSSHTECRRAPPPVTGA